MQRTKGLIIAASTRCLLIITEACDYVLPKPAPLEVLNKTRALKSPRPLEFARYYFDDYFNFNGRQTHNTSRFESVFASASLDF